MINLFVLLSAHLVVSLASAKCVTPTGIKNPSVYSALPPNSPAPTDSIFFSHILLVIPQLSNREAPIQFHTVHNLVSPIFNTMGAFEELALDVWGNEQPVRFCKDAPNFALYRSVALAHIANMIFKELDPGSATEYDGLATSWGIDPNLCSKPKACADKSTPWGLAFFRFNQIVSWLSRDGWNRDGSLSREFNKIPYQDWSRDPYIPRNSPWRLSNKRTWQPLLEDNGVGFLFHQEHVTPHVGQYARSFFVDDKTHCSLSAPNPRYSYAKELNMVISRSAKMAEDDVAKARIQLFDSKATSLLVLQAELAFANGSGGDTWEFIVADMMGASSLYESLLLVWKEKVNHDAIRPPTRMASDRSGQRITAFAGPFQGRKSMLAEEWEPYIRTMPHAEYPSGSACSCTAFSIAMSLLFESDQFMTNGKGVTLSLGVNKGQSIVEPGLPASDVKLTFSKWSNVAKECGLSRLEGGMHFTAAVSAGNDLCAPIGKLAYEAVTALVNGVKPAFVQDFGKRLQKKRRCRKR